VLLDERRCPIRAAIVDDENLVANSQRFEGGGDVFERAEDVVFLAVRRDNDLQRTFTRRIQGTP